MKTNKIRTMAIIVTLIFCGLPQNAFSQENKVKKVKYLGHKYEGQVNKDKVPEGDGTMNIGGLIIKGKFEGTVVCDAEVCMENESATFYGTSYSGIVYFDESDNVTLKASGKMAIQYFEGPRWFYKPNECLKSFMDLKEDRVVNLGNFNPEEWTISYIADYVYENSTRYERRVLLSRKINPPTITYSYIIKPSTIELKVKKDPNGSDTDSYNFTTSEVKAYVDDLKDHVLKNLEGYKDDEGRIWDYSYKWTNGHLDMKLKVTYPNGSYYYDDDKYCKFQINYSDGRQLFYDKNLGYSIDDIIYLWPWDRYDPSDIFCNNINVFPTKGHLGMDTPKRVYVKSDKVSSSEIGDYIDKSINILLDNSETLKYVDNINSNNEKDNVTLGYMEDGRYVSKNDHDAAKAAADAKAEKERKAKLAPYIKGFGFNPSGKSIKQLVAVGRSFSLVNDYLNDYYVGGQNFWFSFAEDTGISKGYRVIMNNKRVGYIYVQNNRIISVTWR